MPVTDNMTDSCRAVVDDDLEEMSDDCSCQFANEYKQLLDTVKQLGAKPSITLEEILTHMKNKQKPTRQLERVLNGELQSVHNGELQNVLNGELERVLIGDLEHLLNNELQSVLNGKLQRVFNSERP